MQGQLHWQPCLHSSSSSAIAFWSTTPDERLCSVCAAVWRSGQLYAQVLHRLSRASEAAPSPEFTWTPDNDTNHAMPALLHHGRLTRATNG
jgi:hypothetical protein